MAKPTHAVLIDAGRIKAAIAILESLDSSPEARRAGQAAASDVIVVAPRKYGRPIRQRRRPLPAGEQPADGMDRARWPPVPRPIGEQPAVAIPPIAHPKAHNDAGPRPSKGRRGPAHPGRRRKR